MQGAGQEPMAEVEALLAELDCFDHGMLRNVAEDYYGFEERF